MADGAGTPYCVDEGYFSPDVYDRLKEQAEQDARRHRGERDTWDGVDDHSFYIHLDGSGLYRWTLTDGEGRFVQNSRFHFSSYGEAVGEVKVEKAKGNHPGAKVIDENGRDIS